MTWIATKTALKMLTQRLLRPICNRIGFFERTSVRDQHKYIHDLSEYRLLPDSFGCRVDVHDDTQDAIVTRLIDYYHRVKTEAALKQVPGGNDMWKEISQGHAAFESVLETRDVATASDMFLNICNTPLVVGFENSVNAPAEHIRFLSLNVVDKYLALGHALGCIPTQCPEQGAWGYKDLNLDALHDLIQSRLPFDVTAPKAGGGTFGLRTKHGIVSERNLQAIHTAVRVRSLLEEAQERIVAEIGGGIGGLAYYLAKAGMDEISTYDLPIVSIVQGYYLMKSLGAENVWLHGEALRAAKVRVFPYWKFAEAPDSYYTLVINQDSMPEIDRNIAVQYMRLIARKARTYFLSVNQEGQGTNLGARQSIVGELVEATSGFQRIHRCPDWMREGYVAETYRIQKP